MIIEVKFSAGRTLDSVTAPIEKELVRQALSANAGHITNTAKALLITRPTLYRLIAKHFSESERLFLLGKVEPACPV